MSSTMPAAASLAMTCPSGATAAHSSRGELAGSPAKLQDPVAVPQLQPGKQLRGQFRLHGFDVPAIAVPAGRHLGPIDGAAARGGHGQLRYTRTGLNTVKVYRK